MTRGAWSDALAWTLLSALSDEEIAAYWGVTERSGFEQRRRDLCAWTSEDADVRRWLIDEWRARNDALVEETESYAPEELAARVTTLWERRSPRSAS